MVDLMEDLVDVDPEQPPNQKERDDGQQDVAEPLAWSIGPAKVEHAAMVAQGSRCLRGFGLL